MSNTYGNAPIALNSIRKLLENYFTQQLEPTLADLGDQDFQTRVELLTDEFCDAFEDNVEDYIQIVLDFAELYFEKCVNASEDFDSDENGATSNTVIEIGERIR